MSKWVGNRFGNNPVGVTTFFVSAVHKMYDQYYAKQSGGWKPEPFTASGGTTYTATHGSTPYKYHVFTASSDTFTVLTGVGQVEALIVAGGGGGGAGRDGGGGGAGGFRVVSGTLTPGPYPIVIGAGGAAMPYWAGYSRGYPHPSAARGGSSTAFGFTSTGGGGRTAPSGPPGTTPGGSGCGAAIEFSGQGTGNTPPVSPPQGNPGGTGGYVYPGPEPGFLCGGGGGAGANGGNATTSPLATGNGGIGSRSDGITPLAWTIPASYGTPGPAPGRYFAGGGGGAGGTWQGTPPGGTGGSGGGGPKGTGGTAGTTNTGGGGGGGNFSLNNNYSGGSGGSGIIFVRYAQ